MRTSANPFSTLQDPLEKSRFQTETLRNTLLDAIRDAESFPPVEAISLLLSLKGWSVYRVARECGTTRTSVYNTIHGIHNSKRVRACITEILGVDIWQ